MSSKVRSIFSIRSKFLLVMSALLVGCVSTYLLIAIKVFKEDKTELIYDLNRGQVSTLSSELDHILSIAQSRAQIFLESKQTKIFEQSKESVFAGVYNEQGELQPGYYMNALSLEPFGLSESDVLQSVRLTENRLKKDYAVWSLDSKGLIAMAMPFDQSVNHKVQKMWIVSVLQVSEVLSNMEAIQTSAITILNSDGEEVLSLNDKTRDWLADSVFTSAISSSVKVSVQKAENKLYAYAKSFKGNLLVLAETEESQAFQAISQLIERSLIFSSLILTLAVLLAVLLSRSLTRPLEALSDSMEKVASGDLNIQVAVQSRDETSILANTFNHMIADLKFSRDALEKMNRELDQKVKERTKQLEEQNLKVKEAQEALLRTTRLASAGEIAGRTAHEVLNPLTAILTRISAMEKRILEVIEPKLSFAKSIFTAWNSEYNTGGLKLLATNWEKPSEVLKNKNLFQEDMENFETVFSDMNHQLQQQSQDHKFLQQEGDRINRIVNGMRKLSTTKSELKVLSVHDLIQDSYAIMADLFEKENFKVNLSLDADQDLAMVDHDEFVQAMTNLLRNSYQALCECSKIEKRKFSVDLSTEIRGDNLVIAIHDNGVGISKENQSKLFETGFTTKSSDEGTGLGLGISRRFIRAFGGDISFVSSETHKGTTFELVLPLFKDFANGRVA